MTSQYFCLLIYDGSDVSKVSLCVQIKVVNESVTKGRVHESVPGQLKPGKGGATAFFNYLLQKISLTLITFSWTRGADQLRGPLDLQRQGNTQNR